MRIPSDDCPIATAVKDENRTAKVRDLTMTMPPENVRFLAIRAGIPYNAADSGTCDPW
jgi:hypothetical protein